MVHSVKSVSHHYCSMHAQDSDVTVKEKHVSFQKYNHGAKAIELSTLAGQKGYLIRSNEKKVDHHNAKMGEFTANRMVS